VIALLLLLGVLLQMLGGLSNLDVSFGLIWIICRYDVSLILESSFSETYYLFLPFKKFVRQYQ